MDYSSWENGGRVTFPHYCIECNPVRAGMVAHPGEYRWSSYRSHADGVWGKLLSTHEQYDRLGYTAEERQHAYRELFRSELDGGAPMEIRDTVNRGWPLGGERFKDKIERALQRAARPPRRGRLRCSEIPSEQDEHFT